MFFPVFPVHILTHNACVPHKWRRKISSEKTSQKQYQTNTGQANPSNRVWTFFQDFLPSLYVTLSLWQHSMFQRFAANGFIASCQWVRSFLRTDSQQAADGFVPDCVWVYTEPEFFSLLPALCHLEIEPNGRAVIWKWQLKLCMILSYQNNCYQIVTCQILMLRFPLEIQKIEGTITFWMKKHDLPHLLTPSNVKPSNS